MCRPYSHITLGRTMAAENKCSPEPSTLTGGSTLPTHLYHGTTTKMLASILPAGLRPRGRRKGNWKEYPSRPDMVYLTTAYAPYFALHRASERNKGVIVEVDASRLDPDLLHPDEDWVAQCLAHQRHQPLAKVHEDVRANLQDYQHHALDSLEAMGNIAYRGVVPPQAISRYAIIPYRLYSPLFWIALDPCISPLNYKFCGAKYRSLISWIMGDREDFDCDGFGNQTLEMQERVNPEYVANLRQLWKNRDGILVIKRGNFHG